MAAFQVSLVGLGARGLGLSPVHALQLVFLGPPIPFWASVSPYVHHVQSTTKEPTSWME